MASDVPCMVEAEARATHPCSDELLYGAGRAIPRTRVGNAHA